MKVLLREIPCERSLALSNAFVREAVATLPIRVALERADDDPDAGAASAELSILGEEENVFVHGHVSGWVAVACSRCVEPVRVSFEEKINVTYLPRAQVPNDDPDDEIEVTEDDIDVYPYDHEAIDLEPLVREQIILSVPYAPLCRDDCKGLCAVCGIDLNRESCQCDTQVIDPRLAALKNIKV